MFVFVFVRNKSALLVAAIWMAHALCFGVAVAAPPDDFSTPISGATGSIAGSTTIATGQANEYVAPYSSGNNQLNSHWYSWTAPSNGNVSFRTCSVTQTNYDTTLAAFNKNTLPLTTDTPLVSNDDTANCDTNGSSGTNARGSVISFPVTAGVSYAVQVDGYQSIAGDYLLSWTFTGPSFSITKSSSPSSISAPGAITYTVTVDNTGNATLTNPNMTDTLNLGGSPRTLTSVLSYVSGDNDGDGRIDVPEIWTYTATYNVTQADIDSTGDFSNLATLDTNQTIPLTSNAAVTTVTRTPSLTLNKTWAFAPGGDILNNGTADLNDIIRYTFETTNNGNVSVSTVDVVETAFSGSGSSVIPANETVSIDVAPLNDSTDATVNDGIWSLLRPGDAVRFVGNYTVVQADIDNQ